MHGRIVWVILRILCHGNNLRFRLPCKVLRENVIATSLGPQKGHLAFSEFSTVLVESLGEFAASLPASNATRLTSNGSILRAHDRLRWTHVKKKFRSTLSVSQEATIGPISINPGPKDAEFIQLSNAAKFSKIRHLLPELQPKQRTKKEIPDLKKLPCM